MFGFNKSSVKGSGNVIVQGDNYRPKGPVKYFVSYTIRIGDSFGHANEVIETPSLISEQSHIRQIEAEIAKAVPNATQVCITNFIRL